MVLLLKQLVFKNQLVLKKNKKKTHTPLLKWCCHGVVVMGMDGVVVTMAYVTGSAGIVVPHVTI